MLLIDVWHVVINLAGSGVEDDDCGVDLFAGLILDESLLEDDYHYQVEDD